MYYLMIIFCYSIIIYYINLSLSIICYLFSGNIYFSFGISINLYSSGCDYFAMQYSSNHRLFLLNYSFCSNFKCICCRWFSITKKVLGILTTYVFAHIYANIFRNRQKSIISKFNRIGSHC